MKLEPEDSAQAYLIRRAGYSLEGTDSIVLFNLNGGGRAVNYDPYAWGDRTFLTAHKYIIENFDVLKDGDIIDVEFILGETTNKKTSERFGDGDGYQD